MVGKGGIRGIPKHLPNTPFKGREANYVRKKEAPARCRVTKEKVVLNEINSKLFANIKIYS